MGCTDPTGMWTRHLVNKGCIFLYPYIRPCRLILFCKDEECLAAYAAWPLMRHMSWSDSNSLVHRGRGFAACPSPPPPPLWERSARRVDGANATSFEIFRSQNGCRIPMPLQDSSFSQS